jgi:NADH-ubiquinone oxidoreductase chain 2
MINLRAMDVYDGTPTIVTVWLTIIVKITILIFLVQFIEFTLPGTMSLFTQVKEYFTGEAILNIANSWYNPTKKYSATLDLNTGVNIIGSIQIKNLLLISSLLSLLIGTIAGLSQIKVKRLLAFSSISHVGFLLLALGIFTQKSVDSFIFYLIQYSITSLNIFLILLAFGYLLINYKYLTLIKRETDLIAQVIPALFSNKQALASQGSDKPIYNIKLGKHSSHRQVSGTQAWYPNIKDLQTEPAADINYLVELKGQLIKNPVLSISFAICLFSMAGIPPLIGFFSKQFVLFSSIENGNNFLSIVAILVSVISASYYLKLIKITFFDQISPTQSEVSDSLFVKKDDSLSGELHYSEEIISSNLDGALNGEVSQVPGVASLLYREQAFTGTNVGTPAFVGQALPTEIIWSLSNIHSYLIAILTFLILFFFLDPSILLNGTQLISLTIFNI